MHLSLTKFPNLSKQYFKSFFSRWIRGISMLDFGILACMLTSLRCFEFPSSHALSMLRKSLEKFTCAVYFPVTRKAGVAFRAPPLAMDFMAKTVHVLLTLNWTETLAVAHTCACFLAFQHRHGAEVSQNTVEIICHAWKCIPFSCCKASHRPRLQQVPFMLVRAHCIHSPH